MDSVSHSTSRSTTILPMEDSSVAFRGGGDYCFNRGSAALATKRGKGGPCFKRG